MTKCSQNERGLLESFLTVKNRPAVLLLMFAIVLRQTTASTLLLAAKPRSEGDWILAVVGMEA